jgi:hypothetical protein
MTAATTIVRQPALASSPQPTPTARALIAQCTKGARPRRRTARQGVLDHLLDSEGPQTVAQIIAGLGNYSRGTVETVIKREYDAGRRFDTTRQWLSAWGPAQPGVAGCWVPAEILRAFGFDAFTISNDKFGKVETLPRPADFGQRFRRCGA